MSNDEKPELLSPISLAFVGDAVYGLLVREMLIKQTDRPANELHRLSVEYVNAKSQAQKVKQLLPILSEEETAVFKRGRNAHSGHTPKNQTEGDYHYATGFEALFGYLYLKNETERINKLFEIICGGNGI